MRRSPSSASISATLLAWVGETHWSVKSFTVLPLPSASTSHEPKLFFPVEGQP